MFKAGEMYYTDEGYILEYRGNSRPSDAEFADFYLFHTGKQKYVGYIFYIYSEFKLIKYSSAFEEPEQHDGVV